MGTDDMGHDKRLWPSGSDRGTQRHSGMAGGTPFDSSVGRGFGGFDGGGGSGGEDGGCHQGRGRNRLTLGRELPALGA
jgi:hypothetical protein